MIKLQWGRALSSAEIGVDSVAAVVADTTSMGPRPFERGNFRAGAQPCQDPSPDFNGAAPFRARKFGEKHFLEAEQAFTSMGPRPFERGNVRFPRDRQPKSSALLQWGRALSSAEIRNRCVARGRFAHFNGAAPFRARKFEIDADWLREQILLQWGRALSSAEIRTTRSHPRSIGTTSMGPRPFERGNSERSREARHRPAYFNGAAPFRARKFGS